METGGRIRITLLLEQKDGRLLFEMDYTDEEFSSIIRVFKKLDRK